MESRPHAVFEKLKQVVTTYLLKFYDVNDAVLLQKGTPVVSFTTKALRVAEKNTQIEKETLAIEWACKKFHDYLYGMIFRKQIHKLQQDCNEC